MASTEQFLETPLVCADLDGARALVELAGWNQTAADWCIFLELGQGFAIKDAQGRLGATAATLPYASGFGWISMVLVAQALRHQGIATRLLGRCIEVLKSAGLVPVLDATPAGREVYKRLGFHDGWQIQRWRRTASVRQAAGVPRVRALTDADWPALRKLDAAAFGCDRGPLLARLRARSGSFACVAGDRDSLRGFLLGRDGRTATQFGPIVAEDEATAVALSSWAADRVASPVIVDALQRHALVSQWLEANGFEKERPYTRMALGQDELFGDPGLMTAIAGPELG